MQHWLRRQIGSLLPEHRDHARKEWTTEEVRCVTARDVLSDWAKRTGKGGMVEQPEALDVGDEEKSGKSGNLRVVQHTGDTKPFTGSVKTTSDFYLFCFVYFYLFCFVYYIYFILSKFSLQFIALVIVFFIVVFYYYAY